MNRIVAGGIVTPKPLGIVSNNPNFNAEQKQAEKQAMVDALAAKLAANHEASKNNANTNEPPKRWSVKF